MPAQPPGHRGKLRPSNTIALNDLRNMKLAEVRELVEPVIIIDGRSKERTPVAVLVPYDQYTRDSNLLAGFLSAAKEVPGVIT